MEVNTMRDQTLLPSTGYVSKDTQDKNAGWAALVASSTPGALPA